MKDLVSREDIPEELFGKEGSLTEANLEVHSRSGSVYNIAPKLAIAKGDKLAIQDTLPAESLILQLQEVKSDNSIVLGVKESNAIMDYITLKAYKFPLIRMLWLGVVITAIGILMSMVQRIRKRN